eukprot:TRINITY_DN47210_c0_g1_i1.p1 TRINITY_DN47210_c0_g1~~TRINITY_DN47210_c0_g1_i1.p1  ORF type:complete len:335 (-),score=49.74 TRINITY_DN47210_c0_g1_i1:385-1389(-)
MSVCYDINGTLQDAPVKVLQGDDVLISDAFPYMYSSALLFLVLVGFCILFDFLPQKTLTLMPLLGRCKRFGLGVIIEYLASKHFGIKSELRGNQGEDSLLGVKHGVKHLAVIMDGNRRFGKATYGDALRGHRAGGETLVQFIDHCMAEGIEMLTVYAFSTENWNRSTCEVETLMSVLCDYSEEMLKNALEKDIRVRIFASEPERLPMRVSEKLQNLENATKDAKTFSMNVCVSYGARQEIVSAARRLAEEVEKGKITADQIDEDSFADQLCTRGLREPDVLLRTSGERRLSNFLLFQLAYTELVFVEKMWPEMGRDDLRDVLLEYTRRQRRFGK